MNKLYIYIVSERTFLERATIASISETWVFELFFIVSETFTEATITTTTLMSIPSIGSGVRVPVPVGIASGVHGRAIRSRVGSGGSDADVGEVDDTFCGLVTLLPCSSHALLTHYTK